jgi:ATP-dependent DNA helicase RecG
MGNTFLRSNDGDRKCTDDAVRRMLAEQVSDSRDNRVLKNYTLNDLNKETLQAYRQVLKSTKPTHPAHSKSDIEFLRLI